MYFYSYTQGHMIEKWYVGGELRNMFYFDGLPLIPADSNTGQSDVDHYTSEYNTQSW